MDPGATHRCVVLLDCGPEQLGAPRLAHLAALLVLRRRAIEASAEFVWGVITDPKRRVHSDLTPTIAEDLRRARTAFLPSDDHMDGWAEKLGPFTKDDDLWLVGGPSITGLDVEGSRIVVETPFTPEPDHLVATLLRPTTERRLELPLPEPSMIVRLLRRTLAAKPRKKARSSSRMTPMHFSPDTNRLLGVDDNGNMSAIHVPNTIIANQKQGPGRTRVHPVPEGHEPWAVGFYKRRLASLTLCDGVAHFIWGAVTAEIPAPDIRPPPQIGRMVARTLPGSGHGQGWIVEDASDTVWGFDPRVSEQMHVAAEDVFDWDPAGRLFENADRKLIYQRWGDRKQQHDTGIVAAREAHLDGPCCAIRLEDGRWQLTRNLFSADEWRMIHVDPAQSVQGVTWRGQTARIVTMDANRKRLWAWGTDGAQPIVNTPHSMAHAVSRYDRPLIAWYTPEEGLTVVNAVDLLPLLDRTNLEMM